MSEWEKEAKSDYYGSVLPVLLSHEGREDEPTEEVIFVDSISGGQDYENNMPRRLTIIRKLADGQEYRGVYLLKEVGESQLREINESDKGSERCLK